MFISPSAEDIERVESVLSDHLDTKELAVLPATHTTLGNVLTAVVVLAEGCNFRAERLLVTSASKLPDATVLGRLIFTAGPLPRDPRASLLIQERRAVLERSGGFLGGQRV